jgi:hypothetical protein
MKAVSKFKRHSRSLSQQSLNKMMTDVKKEDTIEDTDEQDDLVEVTKHLHV